MTRGNIPSWKDQRAQTRPAPSTICRPISSRRWSKCDTPPAFSRAAPALQAKARGCQKLANEPGGDPEMPSLPKPGRFDQAHRFLLAAGGCGWPITQTFLEFPRLANGVFKRWKFLLVNCRIVFRRPLEFMKLVDRNTNRKHLATPPPLGPARAKANSSAIALKLNTPMLEGAPPKPHIKAAGALGPPARIVPENRRCPINGPPSSSPYRKEQTIGCRAAMFRSHFLFDHSRIGWGKRRKEGRPPALKSAPGPACGHEFGQAWLFFPSQGKPGRADPSASFVSSGTRPVGPPARSRLRRPTFHLQVNLAWLAGPSAAEKPPNPFCAGQGPQP